MKRITTIFTAIAVSVAALFTTSCVQDLDVTPIDPNIQTPEEVLNSIEAYQQLLAKCYGGLSVSASEGPDSSPDIDGIDGGYGQYMLSRHRRYRRRLRPVHEGSLPLAGAAHR